MKYIAYKLQFKTALHIGRGKLVDWSSMISGDVVFSSMCHEAFQLFGEAGITKLVNMAIGDSFRISDAFPYHGDEYYLPKPLLTFEDKSDGNSVEKKNIKKLQYIRWNVFDEFQAGKIKAKEELDRLKSMGSGEVRTMTAVPEDDDASPFSVGVFKFAPNWGLYVILAYETETEISFIEELLTGLGFTGIGGKKSTGLGKFNLHRSELPESLAENLRIKGSGGCYTNLSLAMADNSELHSVLDKAHYLLVKKSGFVSSENYADSFRRKKDFFMFKSGSVFQRTFNGVIADVSSGGRHPVYRYGKPVFLEVKQ